MSVRDGLRSFRPDPHRIAEVGTVGGVRYVDDSKATNPHAAEAALASFESIVWVAGGPAQGRRRRPLVEKFAGIGLRGRRAHRGRTGHRSRRTGPTRAGCPGRRPRSPPTLVPWTPRVPESVMDEIVAGPQVWRGDVVLLAPAAASMDMFTNYGARGDAFEAAVRGWGSRRGSDDHERDPPRAARKTTVAGRRRDVAVLAGSTAAVGAVVGALRVAGDDLLPAVGATAALVVIGLVMVLSASMVTALKTEGSSYAVFTSQAIFAGIGPSGRAHRSAHAGARCGRRLAFPIARRRRRCCRCGVHAAGCGRQRQPQLAAASGRLSHAALGIDQAGTGPRRGAHPVQARTTRPG
jgi:hypothetical protein